MEIKRNFVKGVMNQSLDDRLLPDGVYREAVNIKVSSTDTDGVGTVQNHLGNTEKLDINDLLTDEGFISQNDLTPVGSYTDNQNNDIYWLLTSTSYDIIAKYHESETGGVVGSLILVESRSKTTTYMKFDQGYLFTGINLVDRLLFFTDGNTEPKRINVDQTYRDTTDTVISEDTVYVIVKPPLESPVITLVEDTQNKQNNIEDKFIRFAYRYVYENNEISALSPFSKTAFQAQPFKFDFATGRNESMRNSFNAVKIEMDKGSEKVKRIDVIMKDSMNKNAVVVTSINVDENSPATITYEFSNNKINKILPDSQLNRLFDNVPYSAKAQDIIGRRLVYGNYKQFIDLKRGGVEITPKMELIHEPFDISNQLSSVAHTFKSGRDYEAGIAYLDQFGRMTTVIESEKNTVHVPITSAKNQNNLTLRINHRAPDNVSSYRVFLKQNKGTYYNIIPITTHKEGLFVYFQIARYDIDKVKEGAYIYIKSTPKNNIVFDDKFKILEAEVKEENFLAKTSGGFQDAGFYIKVKIDGYVNSNEFSFKQVSSKVIGRSTADFEPLTYKNKSAGTLSPDYKNHVDYHVPHYGKGSNKKVTAMAFNPNYNFDQDKRFFIEVDGKNTFRYRFHDQSSWIEEGVVMNSFSVPNSSFQQYGNRLSVVFNGKTYVFAYIFWDDVSSGYTIGDTFRVNCRGKSRNISGNPIRYTQANKRDGGFVLFPEKADKVLAGTVIEINISDPSEQGAQKFISSSNYDSIEEWFYEDLINERIKVYNSKDKNIGSSSIFFRRGFPINYNQTGNAILASLVGVGRDATDDGEKTGVYMLIKSDQHQSSPSTPTFIRIDYKIQSPENVPIIETDGQVLSDDIYYELPTTYPIVNGLHYGADSTVDEPQTSGSPAEIQLKDFNAITFGNGMESSVIEDDFNGAEILPSPRANAPIENYGQVKSINSVTYSGVYNSTTSTNGLNEFNLSLGNFKDLEQSYGPVQKLYARDADLIVFQEDKVSKVLFGKNLLSDSVGGGSVVSIPEVLGTQMPYTAEFGISNNPESFAKWGNDIFFTDEKRGAVLNLSQNGINQISSYGMRSFFRDLFDETAGKQKLGSFDPHEFKYVLTWNEYEVKQCEFSVDKDEIVISGEQISDKPLFAIYSNSDWSISITQDGNWLTLNTTSGTGNKVISGSVTDNTSNTVEREAYIIISYCGGQTKTIPFIQSNGKKKQVVVVTTGDKTNDGGKNTSPTWGSPNGGYQGGRTPIDNEGKYYTYDPIDDFLGIGNIPQTGESVDIIGDTSYEDSQGRPFKPFNPDLGNKMYYLETDTKYTADEGDSLVSASTQVTPTLDVDKYKGTFTYNGTNDNLYLVIDYTNVLDMNTTVTGIPTSGTTLPESINLNNSDDIGRYTLTYSSNSTNIRFVIENSDGAVIADTGYVSTPSSETIDVLRTSTGADVVKVYGPNSGDTYDISLTAVTLTSFSIGDTGFDEVADACSHSSFTTMYHNGSLSTPELGDIIYTNSDGSTIFDGENKKYKVGGDAIIIDEDGVLIGGESCTCSETAVPTVSQNDIVADQNKEISISISATNNPTSFDFGGDCKEFEFFGGNGGAVFQGTDCTTGLVKSFSVSSNETVRHCYFVGSVSKLGGASDASYTQIGGCSTNALPDGLQFSPLSGLIYGTPTEYGEFEITVNATNCFGTSNDETFVINIMPEREPNAKFRLDASNPQSSSSSACSIGTPVYGDYYHNGILEYPVIYDMIYSDPEGYNSLDGNNQWFLMENGVTVLVDGEGIVTDTFLCDVSVPSIGNVQLAYGSDSGASCSNSTFGTYYYTGTLGLSPGKLYTDSGATTYAASGWYKFDLNGSWVSFEWDGTDWSGGQVDCP